MAESYLNELRTVCKSPAEPFDDPTVPSVTAGSVDITEAYLGKLMKACLKAGK